MLPPPSSSTIHPLTKAVFASLIQTYRFPEKSFSPSIPLTASTLGRIELDCMKAGANVLEAVETEVLVFEALRRCLGADMAVMEPVIAE